MKTLILLLLMTSVCYAHGDNMVYVPSKIDYVNKDIKELKLDIAESRKREDLLNQEVHLLQYQIDVLTKKDAK